MVLKTEVRPSQLRSALFAHRAFRSVVPTLDLHTFRRDV